MTENLLILNEVFEEGPSSFDGKFYQFSDLQLSPQPLQQPRPDFLVGGEHDRAFKRATRLGEGWVSASNDFAELADAVEGYRAKGGDRVILNTDGVVVRTDAEQAYEEAILFNKTRREPHHQAGNPSRRDERTRFQRADEFRRYADDRMFIVGDPDECIEKITKINERFEPDELILRIDCGWDVERSNRTLELLCEEVLPSF